MAKKDATEEGLKKLDAQLECSLCLDTYKDPKILPCFHVFCKPCLEKLVIKDGQSLCCPTCRHIVPLSAKGVAGLQSDFHVDRLFEIRQTFKKTPSKRTFRLFGKAAAETTETQCGSCEDGKATGYCRDCGEFVCNDCKATHKKVKILKDHKILTLDEAKDPSITIKSSKKKTFYCEKHPDNQLQIYCETCSLLICNACLVSHQEHTHGFVTEVFPKHKEELVSSLKPVKKKLDKLQQAIRAYDTRAEEIHHQKATLEAGIHKEFDQQHKLLDQQKSKIMSDLSVMAQQKLKSLAAQRDQVEMTHVKYTSCLTYAEGGLETGRDEEVLAMKAPVLKRIRQISSELDLDTIQPETEADIQLLIHGKELLQLKAACKEFLEVTQNVPVSAEKSGITGIAPKFAKTGERKVIVLQAMTEHNQKFKGKIELTVELVHTKSEERVKCTVVRRQNGYQYEILYSPVKRGIHKLHITIDGDHVRGSPYPITVTPSPQSLRKPIRVIRGFNKPRGTAVNSKGQIIVVEGGASCISVLTPEGEKVRTFGTKGSENGQFSNPHGVTVDFCDNIYVADYGNDRIQKFTSEGMFIGSVGRQGRGNLQFNFPVGISYNPRDHNLYVCDNSNHRIQVISTGLAFMRSFGKRGIDNGEFLNPHDVAFDDASLVYVNDYDNKRVQVFNTSGHFRKTFKNKARGEKINSPRAIAIDSSNTVFVSENEEHCVSVFTSQGEYITSFGSRGVGAGYFEYIYGLSVDHNDSIIVSDWDNGMLQIF